MALNTSKVTRTLFLLLVSTAPAVFISSTAVMAEPVPVVPPHLRTPLPKVCIDRGLSENACAKFLSQLQDSRILRDIRIQRIPEIKIPDRCLSCPPIPTIDSQIQPVVK